MKVEIWSDVMCPFCYIGKRKFEMALEKFDHKNQIEIIWKSYQLSPDLVTDTNITTADYLAKHKSIPLAEAQNLNQYVTQMAKEVGLTYDFSKAVVANSFNAHRLSHFAQKFNKQNEVEEMLFKAYFTEGKNIDDFEVLSEIGHQVGIEKTETKKMLESGSYRDEVYRDIYEAQQIGVRGVPFFVFNRKYAVSGAQDVSVFVQTLQKAFAEWQEANPAKLQTIEGAVCKPDGSCD